MRDSGQAAERRGAKPPGSAKRPGVKSVRLQLHLAESTARRLGVHAALVGRNQSKLADEILTAYLCRYGKGREIFTDDPDVEPSHPTPIESES